MGVETNYLLIKRKDNYFLMGGVGVLAPCSRPPKPKTLQWQPRPCDISYKCPYKLTTF